MPPEAPHSVSVANWPLVKDGHVADFRVRCPIRNESQNVRNQPGISAYRASFSASKLAALAITVRDRPQLADGRHDHKIHLFVESGVFREMNIHHGSLRAEMKHEPHSDIGEIELGLVSKGDKCQRAGHQFPWTPSFEWVRIEPVADRLRNLLNIFKEESIACLCGSGHNDMATIL
jgi:hypothetical protein